MGKKSFKDSARASVASAFMSGHDAQEAEQEVEQHPTHENPQEECPELRRTIRTQGRKGKKKPRINMAFEPDIYEYVRDQAEREDKSLTQCVNDILYEHMKLHKK